MVLAGLGLSLSEAELRDRCDCTVFGTEALKAVDAVRQLGFERSQKVNLSLSELTTLVRSDVYPIVYVNLKPIDYIQCSHAVVVVSIADESCGVYDPMQGERCLPLALFEASWRLMNGLAIVVH